MGPMIRKVAPGVGRLHLERPSCRGHDQPFIWDEIDHFVGIGECAAQKARDKCEAGTDLQWPLGLPSDPLNVGVPVLSMIRVGSICSDDLTWSGDVDGCRNVNTLHEV